jgi:hypothetical protein
LKSRKQINLRPVYNPTERKLKNIIKYNSQNNLILKDEIVKKKKLNKKD